MIKNLIFVLTVSGLLCSCSYFNMNKDESVDQAARCKEIKRRMIFNNPFNSAINKQETTRTTTTDPAALEHNYREEGCE